MDYRMIHACIRVMDLKASETFYQQAFGFKVSRKRDFPEAGFTLSYLTDPSDGFELELTYNYGQKEPYIIGNGYSHLAVSVQDLELAHRQHSDLGFDPTPLKGLTGTASYYFVSDPDGYRVEVVRLK